jgi:hypothetical protein
MENTNHPANDMSAAIKTRIVTFILRIAWSVGEGVSVAVEQKCMPPPFPHRTDLGLQLLPKPHGQIPSEMHGHGPVEGHGTVRVTYGVPTVANAVVLTLTLICLQQREGWG